MYIQSAQTPYSYGATPPKYGKTQEPTDIHISQMLGGTNDCGDVSRACVPHLLLPICSLRCRNTAAARYRFVPLLGPIINRGP